MAELNRANALTGPDVVIEQCAARPLWLVTTDAPGVEDELRSLLDVPLSAQPLTVVNQGARSSIALGPGQWLVTTPGSGIELPHASIVDVSSAFRVIRLSGGGARRVLMRCGTLDFSHAGFPVGSALKGRFADATAIYLCLESKPDLLEVYLPRSYIDYGWAWLVTVLATDIRTPFGPAGGDVSI